MTFKCSKMSARSRWWNVLLEDRMRKKKKVDFLIKNNFNFHFWRYKEKENPSTMTEYEEWKISCWCHQGRMSGVFGGGKYVLLWANGQKKDFFSLLSSFRRRGHQGYLNLIKFIHSHRRGDWELSQQWNSWEFDAGERREKMKKFAELKLESKKRIRLWFIVQTSEA